MASPTFSLTDILIRGRQTNSQVIVSGVPSRREKKVGTPDRRLTMIGQMAIAIALLAFNDLGRSVTPTFLFRNRLYVPLSPHCSKMNKNQCGKLKKISRFLSTGHGILPSRSCKARETMISNVNLFFEEPHQLTKFA